MTRIDALKELLAKVEAGNIPVLSWESFAALAVGSGVYVDPQAQTAMRAYCGSLDAAKALHEAVLPEWPYSIDVREAGWTRAWTDERSGLRRMGYSGSCNDNPARAWLIAVLKALISQEDGE